MHSITRIDATIGARQTVAWPHFSGSTLRGAFGRALRQAACTTGQQTCSGCPLRQSCAYGAVFDPAAPAHPLHPSFRDGLPRYLMQPPALGARQLNVGQSQSFTLVLLPGSQSHHKLIEHILRAAIELHLIQPGLFKLLNTSMVEEPVAPLQTGVATATAAQPQAAGQITLKWHTPLRIQNQGKPIFKPSLMDSAGLVRALLRRQMQWCQLTQQSLPDSQAQTQAAMECTLDTGALRWHDIQRHSGVQNAQVPLGGLIGSATLNGPAQALYSLLPVLKLGEQLHIGKETIMGLGRYQLSPLELG